MLNSNQLIGFGGGAPSAGAVDYGGASRLTRNAALTGVADSPYGTFSVWFRLDANDGAYIWFMQAAPTTLTIYGELSVVRNTDNKIYIRVGVPDPSILAGSSFESSGNGPLLTAGPTWHHLLVSFDTNHTAGNRIMKVYLDDSDITNIVQDVAPAAASMAWTNIPKLAMGADYGGGNPADVAMAEYVFAPGLFVDLTVTGNRRVFNDGAGKAANVGSLADAMDSAFGAAPLVYLTNPADTVNINAAAGGDFVIVGTLTDADSNPF